MQNISSITALLITLPGSCLLPGMAAAQEVTTGGIETAGIPFQRAVELSVVGVYGVLAGLSILMVALIFYLFAVLRRGQVAPKALQRNLLEQISTGHLDDARRICRIKPCPLSITLLTALDHVQSVPDGESLLLRDIVEAEGARQSDSIQGQIQYLTDIAVVAPMLGLLGTVLGMMISFNVIHEQVAVVRPAELASGINAAMRTTAFGLIIGITATIFYALFRRRATRLIAQLESAVAELFTALIAKRSLS